MMQFLMEMSKNEVKRIGIALRTSYNNALLLSCGLQA
jgi:hypothetical protein